MEAKEKAKELLEEFKIYSNDYIDNRQCALIAVQEIIKLIESKCFNKQFFIKVKEEIENL